MSNAHIFLEREFCSRVAFARCCRLSRQNHERRLHLKGETLLVTREYMKITHKSVSFSVSLSELRNVLHNASLGEMNAHQCIKRGLDQLTTKCSSEPQNAFLPWESCIYRGASRVAHVNDRRVARAGR